MGKPSDLVQGTLDLLIFATVSLLLAAVGLFGVLSFVVSQRSKEIGIRFALGAQRPQMLRSMLLDGMRPAFVSVAFGLAGAWDHTADRDASLCDATARSGRVRRRRDGAANRGGDACVPPAWRASRLDLILALRQE